MMELAINENNFLERLNATLPLVDDVVSKNYLAELSNLNVVPMNDNDAEKIIANLRLFKITEMTYQKNEFASHKFATAFNSLSSMDCAVFLIIKSDGLNTSFYMGIRSDDEKHTTSSIKDTLKRAIQGQFPGIKIKDDYLNPDVRKIISEIETDGISSVSCVANVKNHDNKLNNSFFDSVQGLEKFALSMQGEKYTAIILANTTSRDKIIKLRRDYETIYSQLSMFASRQVSSSSNNSVTFSEASTHTDTHGTNESRSLTNTTGHTYSHSEGKNAARTSKKFLGAIGALTVILAPLMPTYSNSTNSSNSESNSSSESESKNYGSNRSTSDAQTRTTGNQSGTSQTITFTQNDKNISDILEKIDTQLKRIKEFESLGMWECAAYFMADNVYTAEIAASSYKALMMGENSGVETSAINSWSINSRDSHMKNQASQVSKYVRNFTHPIFNYQSSKAPMPAKNPP